MAKPDLFIIGAPKSGTTSLYEYLYGHPDIYMSPVKEPFYFSPDVNRTAANRLIHPDDEPRYLALFDGASNGHKRVGEASTRYMRSRVAPSLIHDFQPEARIVAMFRDPVEVMYALHSERVFNGAEDITDFGDAVAADGDRSEGRRLPPGATPASAVYHDVVRFGYHLGRWTEQFGRQRVHAVLLDDLVEDPRGTFRAVLEFLDVDRDYEPPSFAAHNTSHRRSGRATAILRATRAPRITRALLARLFGEHASHRMVRRAKQTRLVRPKSKREPLAPELRDRLRAQLAPEVDLLGEMIGRDLRALWWPSSAPADERAGQAA